MWTRQSLRVYLSHVGDMSSVSSSQSCVHKGAGYNEVFPSGQNNPRTSSEERNLSATSPSTKDEDLDTDRLEGDSTDGLNGAEPPTQSVIGPDGLREFIILPLWMERLHFYHQTSTLQYT